MITKVFPIALITLDLCASAVCIWKGDRFGGWYWFAAAQINFAALMMQKV